MANGCDEQRGEEERGARELEREGGAGEGVGERAGLGGFVTMNTEGNEL